MRLTLDGWKASLHSDAFWLSLWAVLVAFVGATPLAHAPGYESSLILGLVAGFWVPLVARFRIKRQPPTSFLDRAVRGAFLGASHALVGLAVLSLWGALTRFCDGWEGVAYYLLASGFGMILLGVWAVCCASVGASIHDRSNSFLARFLGKCVAAADFGAPLGCALYFGLEFYFTPSVYAFSPFVGHFAGPLYDTVHFPWQRLLSYRCGSLLQLVAVFGFAVTVEPSLGAGARKRGSQALLAGIVGSVALSGFADVLGHRTNVTDLRRRLPGRAENGSCRVHFSPAVDTERARLLARECDVHVSEMRESFGFRESKPVDVYLFASDAEKGELVGARSTNVAKPWRREVYVQDEAFPHPVLRHELAHALSGEWSSGPFGIPGLLGGFIPDPARIEGFAVLAAASGGTDAQNLLGWGRAQLELGKLPRLEELFGIRFYKNSAPRAYSAAGAWFAFVRERYGERVLRAFYEGATLEELTGTSVETLETAFKARLEKESPDPEVLRAARQRFEQKAVFERVCPQRVGRLEDELDGACGVNPDAVKGLVTALRTLDSSARPLLGGVACLLPQERESAASFLRELRAFDGSLASWERSEVLRFEVELSSGLAVDRARALALLGEAESAASSPRARRELQILSWTLRTHPDAFAAVVRFLRARGDQSFREWIHLEAGFAGEREPGVFDYLAGRWVFRLGAYEAAREAFLRAEGHLPTPELERENTRMLALLSCFVDVAPSNLGHGTPDQVQANESLIAYCRRWRKWG